MRNLFSVFSDVGVANKLLFSIQLIVEQRVEKRVQEILEQLRIGGNSPYLSGSGFHRRSL